MFWIAIDPGESCGVSFWEDEEFLDADTFPMADFEDALFRAVFYPLWGLVVEEDDLAFKFLNVKRFVVEDWKIYPWEAKKGSMNWDPCRTARLIGAITLIARMSDISIHFQPAKIKERAEAAGAEAYFLTPLTENRHCNDASRHAVYFLAVQRGAAPIPENLEPTRIDHHA